MDLFGEPCEDTAKYLDYTYKCKREFSHFLLQNKNAFQYDAYRPLIDGGMPARGCLPRGVPTWGGIPAQGGCLPGGCLPDGCLTGGGITCDLSHHAFDVTCMLPPHQLRHNNSAPAYILLPGYVPCKACWDTTPPPPPRQTDSCKNITFANYVCGR